MKAAIRKYLLARKLRRLAQNLEHLHHEYEMNRIYQRQVMNEMSAVSMQLVNLDIKSRREMMLDA
jgi:hypothetical protein